MIKVKTNDLIGSVQILSELATMKLPITAVMKLRRVMKSLGEPLKEFDETRNALMDEYCKPLKDGASTREFKSEKAGKEYNEQIRTASEEEVTLLVQPMRVKDFGVGKDDETQTVFTTNDLLALEWLIPDETNDEDNIQELSVEPGAGDEKALAVGE